MAVQCATGRTQQHPRSNRGPASGERASCPPPVALFAPHALACNPQPDHLLSANLIPLRQPGMMYIKLPTANSSSSHEEIQNLSMVHRLFFMLAQPLRHCAVLFCALIARHFEPWPASPLQRPTWTLSIRHGFAATRSLVGSQPFPQFLTAQIHRTSESHHEKNSDQCGPPRGAARRPR